MVNRFAQNNGNRFGGGSRFGGGFDTNSVNRQIENAETRIRYAGFEPKEDKRNWFEKATNLPEGQNFFFDALDLLDRPGNAVRTAIDQGNDGEGLGKNLWQGFSGKENTRGTDLLDNFGVETNNKIVNGVLGFGAEVLTDPTMLIPGGAIAKGIRGGAQATKSAINVMSPEALKKAVQPAIDGTKNTVSAMFNTRHGRTRQFDSNGRLIDGEDKLTPMIRQTQNKIDYENRQNMDNIINAAKNAGGYDTGSDVGRIMEDSLQQFNETPAYQLPDGRIVERKGQVYQTQRDIRRARNKSQEDIERLYNKTKKQFNDRNIELRNQLEQVNKQMQSLFRTTEKSGTKHLRDSEAQMVQSMRVGADSPYDITKQLEDATREFNQELEKQVKYLESSSGKGSMPGGIIRDETGTVINRYGRQSNNPPWYQEFYRVNGRRPNKTELRNLAKEHLLRGFDDLGGSIPAWQPSILTTIDNQIAQLNEMYRLAPSPNTKQSLDELVAYREELDNAIKGRLEGVSTQKPTLSREEFAFSRISGDEQFKSLQQQREQLLKQIDDNISNQRTRLSEIRNNRDARVGEFQKHIDDLDAIKQEPNAIRRQLIERNKLPLSNEPNIQNAAAELMRSNDAIRTQANKLGININELRGYMRHILSKEERKRRKELGDSVYNVDSGNFGVGNPNDKFLKQRKYTGSAEEINRDVGREVFDTNAYFSTAYGQKQLTEYMHAVDFRRKVLSDPSLAIKYQQGMKVPDGTVKINTKNYQFMRDEDLADMGLLDEVGGEYVVPNAVKTALDQFQRMTTDDGIKGFLKALDTGQSWWKRMALFSLPYHVRNDIGAKFNNYVGGMNAMDIAKYTPSADKEVYEAMVLGRPSKMYDEYLQQGLGANSQSKVEFARMGDDAAKELERLVKNESKTGGAKVANKLLHPFETSRAFGDFVDQTNRYAAYKWAREKKKMSPEQAASKVRQTQFDYNDLTNFEREFMTRVIPFYRWMRNNIPYQISQFVNDPRKFIRVDDFRRNMQSAMGINEENIPEWMTEQFAIPYSSEDDGSGRFLSVNLPVGDLTRIAQPGKTLVDSVSPFAKIVPELTLNRNFFYNSPIQKYEGQQQQMNIPFTDVNFGIPVKPAYALENLTGQIGRNAFDYLQRPEEENQDTKFRTPSLGISSMSKEYDVVKSEYYEKLNELQQLQDRINWIEQQTGVRPPTMNEINQNRRGRFGGQSRFQ